MSTLPSFRVTLLAAGVGAALALSGCRHVSNGPSLTDRDLAELHLSRSEYAQALPLLEKLHRERPSDLEIARKLTEAEVRTQRSEQFIQRLQTEHAEPEAVTHYMLGLARFAGTFQAERAIAEFEQAAALSPSEPEYQYRLGLAWLESEQYPKALAPLRRAHQLAPDRQEILLPLAKALSRTGDRKGAVAALGQLVRGEPTPKEVEVARALMDVIADPFAGVPVSTRGKLDQGLTLLQDRDLPQDAIVTFEEILASYPDLAEVHALLGLAYQKLDDAGRAVEEFKRAIELSPANGKYRLYLAMLYQSHQRTEKAEALFHQALERDPLLDDAWFQLGDVALGRNDLPHALEAFRVLTYLQPDSVAVRGKYALVLQEQGNYPAADRQLRAVVDKHPDNVEFLLRLGLLHTQRHAKARTPEERKAAAAEAEKWLQKVLAAQPQNAVASRALESLHEAP